MLPGVGALADEARDEDGINVNEAVYRDHLAHSSALLLRSTSIFLGEANCLPRSKAGGLEGSPWSKCWLQMRVYSFTLSTVGFSASNHCCLLVLFPRRRSMELYHPFLLYAHNRYKKVWHGKFLEVKKHYQCDYNISIIPKCATFKHFPTKPRVTLLRQLALRPPVCDLIVTSYNKSTWSSMTNIS